MTDAAKSDFSEPVENRKILAETETKENASGVTPLRLLPVSRRRVRLRPPLTRPL
ncbi:MAG: hypothetical protein ACLR06_12375 [Christensenellaceae bacterium]